MPVVNGQVMNAIDVLHLQFILGRAVCRVSFTKAAFGEDEVVFFTR